VEGKLNIGANTDMSPMTAKLSAISSKITDEANVSRHWLSGRVLRHARA
jgi:hypothetical protein